MSDTKKSKEVPNNIIGYMVYGIDEKLKIDNVRGNKQEANIDNIPGIPMEIGVEENIITNETPDKRIAVKDKKTGKIIGYLDKNGKISRKLEEMDKESKEKKANQDEPVL